MQIVSAVQFNAVKAALESIGLVVPVTASDIDFTQAEPAMLSAGLFYKVMVQSSRSITLDSATP